MGFQKWALFPNYRTRALHDAAPCGKPIRKAQSRADPTISVAPHKAPWPLPLFFGSTHRLAIMFEVHIIRFTLARCARDGSPRRAPLPRTSEPTRARSRTLARCAQCGSPRRAPLPGTSELTRARSRTHAQCARCDSLARATFPRTSGPTPARSRTLARCAGARRF